MRKLPAFLVSPSGKIVRVLTSASGSHARYWFSACTVIFTLLFIALGKIIFGSLPLVLFAAAIVTASKCAGIGGGIISVVLSTLACDFFFLPPIFAINFDQTTWTLAAKYGSIALLSCIILRQKRREVAPTARPVRARFGYLDGVAEGEVFGWAIDPRAD
jgi:K+-sensing histidine kinase KdpD